MKLKLLFLFFLLCGFVLAIKAQITGSFTDVRDGQEYKTVKIGNQEWMGENLNYKIQKGSWCFDDNENNCEELGRLYDWNTALKVCPEGWSLPTKDDYIQLLKHVTKGTKGNAGSQAWLELREGGDSGFSAKYSGARIVNKKGKVKYLGRKKGFYWSSTESNKRYAYGLILLHIPWDANISDRNYKDSGYAIRCIKDKD